MNKKKKIFTSIKYIIFSWHMLGFVIYLTFITWTYFIDDSIAPAVIMALALFIPIFLISLSRFWYINMYENYIEVRHLFIPYFRKRFTTAELKKICFEQIHFGGLTEVGKNPTYIPCMILYFKDFERNRKAYWHVKSFYSNYHQIFHDNISKIIKPTDDFYLFDIKEDGFFIYTSSHRK